MQDTEEIWKPIPECERYEVSSHGRVWDTERLRYIWQYKPTCKKQYPYCRLYRHQKDKLIIKMETKATTTCETWN